MWDLAAAGALVAIAVAVFVLTAPFPPGVEGSLSPAFYPRLAAACMILLSVLLAAQGLRNRVGRTAPPRTENLAALVSPVLAAAEVVGLTVLYIIVWTRWRFFLPTVAYVAVVSRLSGRRGWGAALLFGAVVAAVLYLAFGYILRVPLDGI